MLQTYLLILGLFLSPSDQDLQGVWKLQSFDAIDKIKASAVYQNANPMARMMMDERFDLALNHVTYEFSADTLKYTDIDFNQLVHRRAIWYKKDQIIHFEEIDRTFKRSAFVKKLTADTLILNLIVEDGIADSDLVFTKLKEE